MYYLSFPYLESLFYWYLKAEINVNQVVYLYSYKMYLSYFTDKPGPPINLAANDTTKTSTVLTWEPPESDGGSPVTGYFVEKMASYSSRWSKVNKEAVSELTLSLTDLEEKVEYQFRVSAQNAAGTGPPCEPIKIIAKDPFGEST